MHRVLIILIAMLSVSIVPAVAEQVSMADTEGLTSGTIVPIHVSDVKNGIGSATIKLSYNPDIIQIENVSKGDLLYVVSNINNTIGKTVIVAYTAPAINTSVVTIANVKMKSSVQTGTSPLKIDVETLSDSAGNPIAYTVGIGTAVIESNIIRVNWTASNNIQMPVPNPDNKIPTEPGAYATVDGKSKKVKPGDIIAKGEQLSNGTCRINYSVGVRGNSVYPEGAVVTKVNENCEAVIEAVNISYKGSKENKLSNEVIVSLSGTPRQGWAKHEMGHWPSGWWTLTAVTTALSYIDNIVSADSPYSPYFNTFITSAVDWWHLSGSGISRWGDTIGDANLDDVVDGVDAMFVAQYVSGTRTLSDHQKEESDANCDGQITSTDSQFIAEYVAGLRTRLGCKVVIHSWGEFYETIDIFPGDNRHTLNPTFYGKAGNTYANFCELNAESLYWTLKDKCSGGLGQPPP